MRLALFASGTALVALAACRFGLGIGWAPSVMIALLLASVHGAVILAVRADRSRKELAKLRAVGSAFFTEAEIAALVRNPQGLLRERRACPLTRGASVAPPGDPPPAPPPVR
ncbi:MAG: hypothetical protein JNK11_18670 [Alphaproteobacteria bacterium]|nr:hypothetical protein [Alphaproteobacteria bacterium]